MKYRLGITLLLVSALSLYAAPREPNSHYRDKISQKRRSRGLSQATAAAACTLRTATENDTVVVGSIAMPEHGMLAGTGTGFHFVADARTGTVTVTFEELVSPVVTASAHDLDATRCVSVTEQNTRTVTLHITGFTAGNPTVVAFQAIQFENA